MRIEGIALPLAAVVPNSPASATSSASGTDHRRLQDAAHQFEGMMLQEMLKPMQSSEDTWDTDDGSDKSMDTMSSYGIEAMATSLSKAGGLGIAKQVMRQVGLEADLRKGK